MLRRNSLATSLLSSSSSFRVLTKFVSCSSAAAVLLASNSPIHERLPRIKSYLVDENMDAAKSALVQLNVMVSQGIEPDAPMYTSLITIMGRAKLEWQAFKLFSRMLEQGVKPLPETYLALKRATDPKRTKMIQQIEDKMTEMNNLLPEQLVNAAADSKEQNRRIADRQLRELKNPSLLDSSASKNQTEGNDSPSDASPTSSSSSSSSSLPSSDESREDEHDDLRSHYSPSNPQQQREQQRTLEQNQKIAELWKQGKDVPTMKIDSLESVMATVQQLDARRIHRDSIATGEQRAKLKTHLLDKLHDEELRIMLAIQRQSRHGTRQQLLNRVLSEVPAAYLEATLQRRAHYFDSVKQVLELQINELKKMQDEVGVRDDEEADEGQQQQQRPGKHVAAKSGEENDAIAESIRSRQQMKDQLRSAEHFSQLGQQEQEQEQEQQQAPSINDKINPSSAADLTPQERYNMSPSHLETPWGLMRKPFRPPPNNSSANTLRDAEQKLSQEELVSLQNALVGGSMDQVSARQLRRYCRHFHLKWSRRAGPAALQDLVEWHLRTFKPASEVTPGSSSTAAFSGGQLMDAFDAAEEERRAQQQTLDQYNALVAVARITDNMQLVDDASVSKRVIERQKMERLDRKRSQITLDKEMYQRRLEHLNENMRRMPFVSKNSGASSSSSTPPIRLTPAVEDILTKPGTNTPSRVIGTLEFFDHRQVQQRSDGEKVLGQEPKSTSKHGKHASTFTSTAAARSRQDILDEQLIATSFPVGDQKPQQQRDQQFSSSSSSAFLSTPVKKNIQELPPWEAHTSSSSIPFNLRTGKFDIGVPEAEFYEDSTGRYKVRRPHVLKGQYRVDESFLPAPQQQRIRQEKLAHEDELKADEEAKEKRRGKHSWKGQRFHQFVEKQKEKKAIEKEQKIAANGGRPLGMPQRMSQKLKWNAHTKPILHNKKYSASSNRADGEQD